MSMYVSNAINYVSSAIQTVREMPIQTTGSIVVGGGVGLVGGAKVGLYAVEKLASFGMFPEDYKDVAQKGIRGIKDPSLAHFVACVLVGIVGMVAGAFVGSQLSNSAVVYGAQAANAVAKNVFAYMKPLQA